MNLIFLLLPYFTVIDWPATPQQLDALVVQLGSPKFKERQKADFFLRHVGLCGVTALDKATKHKDLEIARRSENIIKYLWNKYYTSFGTIPPIYAIVPESYKQHYWKKCYFIHNAFSHDDHVYVDATYLFIQDMVRAGVPRSVIETQLKHNVDNYHYNFTEGEENTIGKTIDPDLQPYLEKKEFKEYYQKEDIEIDRWYNSLRK